MPIIKYANVPINHTSAHWHIITLAYWHINQIGILAH